MNEETVIILALFPNTRGLGYACLVMPEKKLKDSGVLTIRPICNSKILERIKTFIDFFKPEIVVIKDYGSDYSRQERRGARLVESITKYAKEMRLPVYHYTRQQVRDIFEQFGAKSKTEIAQRIIVWLPELEFHAPRIRKNTMAEEYYMGEFDAISLAITHRYITE